MAAAPSDPDDREQEAASRRADLKWAAFGGVAAAVIGVGGMVLVGAVTSAEARRLLEAMLDTVRFAASAYVAGGATILALMLTLLTFSLSHDIEFHGSHYRRIRQLAALDAAVIIASVVLLMLISVPLDEADVSHNYYRWMYYAVLLGGSATGGIFISVVLMLLYAVRGLVVLAEDERKSDLVVTPPEPDSEPAARGGA